MVAARMANLEPGRPSEKAQICAVTQVEAAERTRVSRRTVQPAVRVLADGAEELVAAVDQARVKLSDAAAIAEEPHATQRALLGLVESGNAKTLIAAHVQRDIERQRLEIAEGRADLPEGVFEVIVVDPPWPYDNKYDPTHWANRTGCRYPVMSIAELRALHLPAAKDCMLWLWTTNHFMGEAYGLLDAWGFEHKTILTWVKPHIGTGHWLRNRTEHCLLAVKGSPKRSLTNQSTVIEAPACGHSRKPDAFYALVDSLCVGRKLDYFSREKRSGWEQFGNDTSKFGDVA